ncbi:NAD(P)/FAD-dependent oxidoreductase [Rhizobium sp. TRM95111]|uniref:NAD(P)/FAD-dependent oxidoreductase n=1 Tax=Rhizobium alarense TaxID=2846851 RepID=UPI001F27B27F|nr:NAD(P)/FAD-dependent oxidoreductase [Rhizobium alarense]MCF3641390.1 NAD(P)/FAD-dependent oxidoreductase [Rhizobium alarense]
MTEDAIIVGGGFAGLSAAMQLARARRRVTVLDTGLPRNRFAAHAHGFLAQDGRPGLDILADARRQLAAYGTVTFRDTEAERLDGDIDAFSVLTGDGERIAARRVLLATGFEDRLPDVAGLAERWGKTVLHCPYCHGYEVGGGPMGVLARTADAARFATIVSDWGGVTLFTNGTAEPEEEALALLERRNVTLRPGRVTAIADGPDGMLSVETGPGIPTLVRALFVMPEARVRSAIPDDRALARKETPIGPIIKTDETGQTSLPGLYAAGDIAIGAGNISFASADGVKAGVMLHHSLIVAAN